MSEQKRWYVWDSRGGIRARVEHIQVVDFDMKKNHEEWIQKPWVKVEGSIESGRMTYRDGPITVEWWREDKPNPTPYTKIDNPDPSDEILKGVG